MRKLLKTTVCEIVSCLKIIIVIIVIIVIIIIIIIIIIVIVIIVINVGLSNLYTPVKECFIFYFIF